MATTIREPRDERAGELGAGLGSLLGGLLQKRRQKQEEQQVQEAFLGGVAASNKEEYLKAVAPIIRTPQQALAAQKRVDELFSTKLQEYEVNLRMPDGTVREKVKWMGPSNMDTLQLKADVDTRLGPVGATYMFGTPKLAPMGVNPNTLAVTTPGPASPKEVQQREGARKSRAERAAGPGTKLTEPDKLAGAMLGQYGLTSTEENLGRARLTLESRDRMERSVKALFGTAFGGNWELRGDVKESFNEVIRRAERYQIMMGEPEPVAREKAYKDVLGKEPPKVASTPEPEPEPTPKSQPTGGERRGVQLRPGVVMGPPDEPAAPVESKKEKPEAEEKSGLVYLGVLDGEPIYVPPGSEAEAIEHLVSQGWKREDAKTFVLENNR